MNTKDKKNIQEMHDFIYSLLKDDYPDSETDPWENFKPRAALKDVLEFMKRRNLISEYKIPTRRK
jgi:hypothetical protein